MDEPSDADRRPIPLFPLLNSLLIPGSVQGLRFFEPRYVAMIRDLLDASPLFVFGTVLGDQLSDLAGKPRVEPVGGLAEILDYRELPNGEYLCEVLGRERVQIDEVPSNRPYRTVEYTSIDAAIEDVEQESALEGRLREEIESRGQIGSELPEAVRATSLGDLLLAQIDIPFKERYSLYSMTPSAARLEAILEVAARR